jgi:hypothetical protein
MDFRFCDETDYCFGWYAEELLRRTSHALLVDGKVWLVDPVAWPDAEERARALGEPAGVIQLLDRHNRDAAAIAARLGVPHLRVPDGSVAQGLEAVPAVDAPFWHERALWWPERRLLVTADALGTIRGYFALGGEPIGLHPLLRLFPPRKLDRLEPDVVLVGHGPGLFDARAAFHAALHAPRRRVLQLLGPRRRRGGSQPSPRK